MISSLISVKYPAKLRLTFELNSRQLPCDASLSRIAVVVLLRVSGGKIRLDRGGITSNGRIKEERNKTYETIEHLIGFVIMVTV